jgi:hypothetical protein
MNSGQNPRPRSQRFDTLGGADPGDREDELAVPRVSEPGGPDVLGGPDTGPEDELAVQGVVEPGGPDVLGGPDTGPEDELAVPGVGASTDTVDDADPGEGPKTNHA